MQSRKWKTSQSTKAANKNTTKGNNMNKEIKQANIIAEIIKNRITNLERKNAELYKVTINLYKAELLQTKKYIKTLSIS